jgi:hypothetical protein
MKDRAAALLVALTLAVLGVACGHPEKSVIDQYFNALRAGDQQTLSSFAAFTFDKKPERWTIKSTLDEQKVPVPYPDLVKKSADADKAQADNKRQAQLYSNDHYPEIEQVKEAQKKGGPLPPKLQPVAAQWTQFNEKDRELKKAAAQAKDAAEKEKRNVLRSVGQMDDLDVLTGEMIDKKVEIDLTINGKVEPYVMNLRKYDLKREKGPKVNSRWVIQSLQPKA